MFPGIKIWVFGYTTKPRFNAPLFTINLDLPQIFPFPKYHGKSWFYCIGNFTNIPILTYDDV